MDGYVTLTDEWVDLSTVELTGARGVTVPIELPEGAEFTMQVYGPPDSGIIGAFIFEGPVAPEKSEYRMAGTLYETDQGYLIKRENTVWVRSITGDVTLQLSRKA